MKDRQGMGEVMSGMQVHFIPGEIGFAFDEFRLSFILGTFLITLLHSSRESSLLYTCNLYAQYGNSREFLWCM